MKKILFVLLTLGVIGFSQTPSAYPGSYQITNDTSTGTTFQKVVNLSSGKAILSATSDTEAGGICVQNCTTSGSAVIAFSGVVGCVVDGTTTLDHWVVLSTTVAGDCHDTGFSTYPSTGAVIGKVVQTSSGAASVSYINLTKETSPTSIRQRSISSATTTVLDDAGRQLYHPGADTTARTWTIDSNANVPYPIGTCIQFVNDTSAGVITISITTDTLVLAGAGTTGSRTLAASNWATACKITSTRWMIAGSSGLT